MSRRRDFGSIDVIERGRRYRVRYWADKHDGKGYRRCSKTIRGPRGAAVDFLASMRLKHGKDAPCPTVGEAYETWYLPDLDAMLANWERDRKPGKRGTSLKRSSYMQLMTTWERHVAPRWEDVRVSDVRYSDIQEWLDTKTEQVGKRCHQQLNAILRFCVRNGVLAANPANDTFRISDRAARYDPGKWTLEELDERLWPAVHGEACEPFFLLSAFGSCRTGEGLSPRLDEVEERTCEGMTMAVVYITRQVYNTGGVSDDDDLKTRWSPRTIVVPEPWSLRVLQLRDEGRARGDVWLSDNGLGEPLSQMAVRKSFYRCLDRADEPRKQLRALRRSWRSWVSTLGVSAEILEKMMGHVGYGTTGRHYLKIDAGLLSKELARAMKSNRIEVTWDYLGQKEADSSHLPAQTQ